MNEHRFSSMMQIPKKKHSILLNNFRYTSSVHVSLLYIHATARMSANSTPSYFKLLLISCSSMSTLPSKSKMIA